MRSKYRVVLAVSVAMLALSAVTASSAFAETKWEWVTGAAEWQQGSAPLSESTGTVWKGTVKVEDKNASGAGDPLVECEAAGKGTVGPGAADTETEWSTSKCTLKHGTCGSIVLEAANLPWHSELTLAEGKAVDVISQDGKGEPGYKLSCTVLGVKVTDTCTATTLKTTTESAAGGVNATFDGEKLNCSVGGKSEGSLEGTRLIEATKGGALQANVSYSKLTKSVEVKSKGELELADPASPNKWSLTCNDNVSGTIGSGGLGTITTISAIECHESKCSSPKVELTRLAWNTELEDLGGVDVVDKISGSGGPADWHIECSNGIRYEATCEMGPAPKVINEGNGDVTQEFDEKVTCSDDGGKGEAAWAGTLTTTPPAGQAIAVRE